MATDAEYRELAWQIYLVASGADNKSEKSLLLAEIEDWLRDGEPPGTFSFAELVALWHEYVAEAEEAE